MDRLRAAADKMADAVAKIDAAVAILSNTGTVTLPDNSTMSGAQFKALWHAIDFTISDEVVSNYNNSGYGEVYRSGSYIKDVLAVNLFEAKGYGDSGYQANQGVVFLALHEAGHMVPGAEAQYSQGHIYWSQEAAQPNTFYSNIPYQASEYWLTNEKWANDFAAAAGAALGLSQSQIVGQVGQGSTGFDWVSPGDIHSVHGAFRPAMP